MVEQQERQPFELTVLHQIPLKYSLRVVHSSPRVPDEEVGLAAAGFLRFAANKTLEKMPVAF